MALNLMCDVRKEVRLICTKAVDVFGVMCVKAYYYMQIVNLEVISY